MKTSTTQNNPFPLVLCWKESNAQYEQEPISNRMTNGPFVETNYLSSQTHKAIKALIYLFDVALLLAFDRYQYSVSSSFQER